MVRACMAPFCQQSSSCRSYSKLSFHRLPLRSASLLGQWMRNMREAGDERWCKHYSFLNKGNPRNYTICSLHFTPECFDPSTSRSPRLKPNAVPTIFHWDLIGRRGPDAAGYYDNYKIRHDHTYALGDATSVKHKLQYMYDKLESTRHIKSLNKLKMNRLQTQLQDTKKLLQATNCRLEQFEYLDSLISADAAIKAREVSTAKKRPTASKVKAGINVKKNVSVKKTGGVSRTNRTKKLGKKSEECSRTKVVVQRVRMDNIPPHTVTNIAI